MNAADAAALAVRHARLRWVGLPLMVAGLALLVVGIISATGGGSWMAVALGLFSTGLGLGAFGANNDTALALAWQARRASPELLPDPLSREIDEELERDRAAILGLHASPRLAMAMPVAAVIVQVLSAWKLLA